jgi:hypothetical protein
MQKIASGSPEAGPAEDRAGPIRRRLLDWPWQDMLLSRDERKNLGEARWNQLAWQTN